MANVVEDTAADLQDRVEELGTRIRRGVDNFASHVSITLDTPFKALGFRGGPGDVLIPVGAAFTEVAERSATRFLRNPLRIVQGVGLALDTIPQTFER